MSIESSVGSLTHDKKLQAMELIWQDLAKRSSAYPSPAWHEEVIAERLENPVEGKALGLNESRTEILANLKQRPFSMNGINAVAASWAIGRITNIDDRTLINELVAKLGSEDPMVRVGAAWALGRIAADAKVAIPALKKLLTDENVSEHGYGIQFVERALAQIEDRTK